ncbi:hypothetical protein JYB87_00245 [Shewanella avicenniae]|uniref:CopL family metal-binding regulatory protein n=1 Tax=Shewanella avicenniae TaxID=2814294 RepID=A0ABX7QSP9_9GAMM|nr:hypothetical protein [Shewanella avicenniae]QSX33728.1 hypothetical protein JYB87_00245 [Shewanella avicenniae]
MHSMTRHIQTLLLLLAFVGQGLLSNGHVMIAPANAQEMDQMMMTHHQMNPVTVHTNFDMSDCCDGEQATKSVLPDAPTHHCCDGKGMCKGNCQCLVVSVAGYLMSAQTPSSHPLPEGAIATPAPHFSSIAANPAFKPPIA